MMAKELNSHIHFFKTKVSTSIASQLFNEIPSTKYLSVTPEYVKEMFRPSLPIFMICLSPRNYHIQWNRKYW